MRMMHRAAILAVLAAVACDASTSTPAPSTSTSLAAATPSLAANLPSTPPEAGDAMRDAAARIAGDILIGSHAMKTLAELTDSFGQRVSGTEAYAKAAAWAVAQFRSTGVGATLETFTFAHVWSPGAASGRIFAPVDRPLRVASFGMSPGTPTPGVRASVIKLDDVSPDAIVARGDAVKGKIAYFDRRSMWRDWATHPMQRLTDAGAVAVLVKGERPNNALDRIMCPGENGSVCTGPVFVVGLEDAASIDRLLEAGPVTLELSSTAVNGGPAETANVVAEIKGRDLPDEVVILGAHLDAWDLATGAQDDGSGVVQVLEAARAIRAIGLAPRRTVRFVLWGGEEQDYLGSRAYAAAHGAEMDRIVAYLNADYGAGAPTGWSLGGGRDDVARALRPVATTLLSGLGADTVESTMVCDSDDCPFWTRGVPTLSLEVDMSEYMGIHHFASDTIDKVKPGPLCAGAAVAAVTTYALAELPQRLAARADSASIAKRLAGSPVLAEVTGNGLYSGK
jgi:carboxypeptidase Q